ncbi:MAG: type III-A CRISPR-associated RAMP protein Csm3, partial [Bacteroidota bacterium]
EAAWKADFSEDTEVTHGKWENVINRRTGTAEHPRQMERVPAGAKFNFELVYSVYEEEGEDTTATLNEHIKRLLLALQLLQDDGIGGQLSRGYGQVKVHLKDIIQKEIKDYQYEVTKLSDSATFDINNPQQLLEAIKH